MQVSPYYRKVGLDLGCVLKTSAIRLSSTSCPLHQSFGWLWIWCFGIADILKLHSIEATRMQAFADNLALRSIEATRMQAFANII